MHINTIFQVGPANFKTKQIGYGSVRKGDWPIRWDFLLFTKKVIGSAKLSITIYPIHFYASACIFYS